MENILLLDVSVGSGNRGDDIIMECVRKELSPLLNSDFELTLPTHVSAFNCIQVWKNSIEVQKYSNCSKKFVGGSNLLVHNLFTHYPQWNIDIFNCLPLKGSVLVGVGASAGAERGANAYTRKVYNKILNHQFYHSVRDERSKKFVESLGLKAINTGCVTMWMLTPEHCSQIPENKATKVVFTLTNYSRDRNDQVLIDTLIGNYEDVYFWPQGRNDYSYLSSLKGTESIKILPPTISAYDDFLSTNDTDYVGTRLHGGIYAMRHKRRAIIIAIDERARAINAGNNLICIEKSDMPQLESIINSRLRTNIIMPFEEIERWKQQFNL